MAGVADWGTVTIGRLTLREGFTATPAIDGSTGFRTLALNGEESMPPLTAAEVQRRQEDILGLMGRYLPVTFTNKTDHNGWYLITDVDTDLTNWTGEVTKFSWSISANRIGPENACEVESHAVSVNRSPALGITGERWHAPAASAFAYYTGTTAQPTASATRAIVDGGSITVYRGLPAGVSPRWSVSLANYQLGRVRILVNAVERVAEDVALPASASWELNNGLVKITTGAASAAPTVSFRISSWSGSAWQAVDWNTSITAASANAVTSWDQVAILRNDYEVCTVRLVKDRSPGRAMLDLTLRRGSRFLETYLQQDATSAGATVVNSWFRASAEAGTNPAASAMYVTATANDANGNRYIVGTGQSGYTALTTQGGLYRSTTASAANLDLFVGVVLGGGSAQVADGASALRDQYFNVISDTVRVSRRGSLRR